MNGESFISKWGYRIRKLLIILLGLELLIKIGNILLPTVIDADLGDIFRFTLENLLIFFILYYCNYTISPCISVNYIISNCNTNNMGYFEKK